MLLPKLGDSLTGRLGIIDMYPFSQGELIGKNEAFLDWIFKKEMAAKQFHTIDIKSIYEMILKGGFPRVLHLSDEERNIWINNYLKTIIERDIKELSQIENIHYLPDLFKLLASRSGSLLNNSDLARTLNLTSSTIHRYLALLETLFMIYRLQAWFINHSKQVAKSPKIYLCDSGILSYLLKADLNSFLQDKMTFGHILESFVVSELLKQASWNAEKINFYHFRDRNVEVDLVLEERGGNIIGIEIKSKATLSSHDFSSLKKLQSVAKKKFLRGIILYSGNMVVPFGKDLWAIPISALWN